MKQSTKTFWKYEAIATPTFLIGACTIAFQMDELAPYLIGMGFLGVSATVNMVQGMRVAQEECAESRQKLETFDDPV